MPIKTFDIPDSLDTLDNHSGFSNNLSEPSFDDNLETFELIDIDQAMFDLLDKRINFHITRDATSTKVPVIFATGERWSLVQQRKPLRDKNGTLILPLVTLRRLEINRANTEQLPGALPPLGSIVYKRKRAAILNSNYQNLNNSLGLRNQDNAARNFGISEDKDPRATSRRNTAKSFTGVVFRGQERIKENKPEVLEIYSIPYPDFFNVHYEISIWAQYQEEANTMLHALFNEMEPFSIDHVRLVTSKGYYFVAFLDETIENESNLDEFSDTERIVRHTVRISTPTYSIGTQLNDDHHVRKYISSPEISFSVVAIDEITDFEDLKRQNPLEKDGRLNDIEDNVTQQFDRPVEKRKEHRSTTKGLKKKLVGESTAFFPNIDELERFFR